MAARASMIRMIDTLTPRAAMVVAAVIGFANRPASAKEEWISPPQSSVLLSPEQGSAGSPSEPARTFTGRVSDLGDGAVSVGDDPRPYDPSATPSELGTTFVYGADPYATSGCGAYGCTGACDACAGGACHDDGSCHSHGWLGGLHHKDACWVGRIEGLVGWRSAPPDRPLVETGLNALPVVNANGMNSPAAGGARYSVFRFNQCNGTGWETTYLRLANWRSERPLAAQSQRYALAPPGFYGNSNTQNFDTGNANLGSRIQSLEFNRHWCHGDHLRFLAGFRWIEWQENFSLADTFNGQQVITDFYATDCINSLYGGQIGLDAVVLTLPWMRFDSVVKAGAYYNNAVQSSLYESNTTGTLISQGVTINQSPLSCAFVGEVGLTGVVPVTSWLDFRVGYMGLWLSGIAQPTQQLSGQVLTQPAGGTDPTTGSINANGGVLVQAVTVGLEGRW
jgi:hypothetical protein